MIVFYIVLVALCLYGISLRKPSDTGFLSKTQGDAVKGIFLLLVFLSHSSQALVDAGCQFTSAADSVYFWIQNKMGQMCVVMFLFFSGYGVMSSIASKGKDYVRSIPRHRALGTLVNFDIAIVIYALVQLVAGKTYPASQYLLALTGWESIGNSNWYIFCIIVLYLTSWLSGAIVLSRRMDLRAIVPINLLLVCILFAVLYFTKEVYWYKTLMAYPLGMAVFFIKPALDGLKPGRWWLLLFACTACYIATYPKHEDPYQLVYCIRTVSFALAVVLLLRRIKIGNRALVWLGESLFPIYIYQRLVMMFVPMGNPYLFIVLSLIGTCAIAWLYRFIRVRL